MTQADAEDRWEPWIAALADALGVDRSQVDVALVRSLTRVMVDEFERPMAHIAAYLAGVAIAAHPELSPEEIRGRILSAIPRAPGGGPDADGARWASHQPGGRA